MPGGRSGCCPGPVLGPVAVAQEHVITGTILLALQRVGPSLGRSRRADRQPQQWAFGPPAFMGVAGVASSSSRRTASPLTPLGWVWPPLFLALLAERSARPSRSPQPLSRLARVPAAGCVCALCSVEAATNGPARRSTAATSHRANWLMSVDTGFICTVLVQALPPSCSNQALGETRRVLGMDFAGRRKRHEGVRLRSRRAEAGRSGFPPQDGVAVAADLHICWTARTFPVRSCSSAIRQARST